MRDFTQWIRDYFIQLLIGAPWTLLTLFTGDIMLWIFGLSAIIAVSFVLKWTQPQRVIRRAERRGLRERLEWERIHG